MNEQIQGQLGAKITSYEHKIRLMVDCVFEIESCVDAIKELIPKDNQKINGELGSIFYKIGFMKEISK